MIVSDSRKDRIIKSCVLGANKYSKLVGHCFELTTENHHVFEIQFNINDFKHLTGVTSCLSCKDFYKNCLNSTISKENIDNIQKKDWNSIKGKLRIIEEIDEMVYGNVDDILLIDVLYTKTKNFPLALRNDKKDSAIAFVDDNLHARSLRKVRHSLNVKDSYQIIRVREKRKNEQNYSRVIYEIKRSNLKREGCVEVKLSFFVKANCLKEGEKKMNNISNYEEHKMIAKKIDEQLDICEIAKELGLSLEKNSNSTLRAEEHDSLIIDKRKNCFFWNSQQQNGGVVKLWMIFKQCTFNECIKELSKRTDLELSEVKYVDGFKKEELTSKQRNDKLVIQLNKKNYSNDFNKQMKNVFAYLVKTRGIDVDVVKGMINDKMIFQINDNFKNTSVAFVGRDEDGYICSVCHRSTNPKSHFKGDFQYSNYERGWFYDPEIALNDFLYSSKKPNSDKQLLVFESNIDMMSYMSILKECDIDYTQYAFLSCGSVSKNKCVLETCKLYGYTNVCILFDNDQAGFNGSNLLANELKRNNISCDIFLPESGKDWNEVLLMYRNDELNLYSELKIDNEKGWCI